MYNYNFIKVISIYIMDWYSSGSNSKNEVPRWNNHRLFLPRVRCSCQDQTIKNITSAVPTDIQNTTSHNGIGFGYNPKSKSNKTLMSISWLKPIRIWQQILGDKGVPCPNLMQMRSSTIQIATESQQNAPTFFTGFLQNIVKQ